jgi:hypothetical protein
LTGTAGLWTETEYYQQPGQAMVVYTDYTNIAARYGCTTYQSGGQTYKQEYYYIQTRSRGFSDVAKWNYVLNLLQNVPVSSLGNMQFNLINDVATCGAVNRNNIGISACLLVPFLFQIYFKIF